MSDPFYCTTAWHRLRAAALDRDRYTCTVPGCGDKAKCVDHVVSRRAGGPDILGNLRSLCAMHDGQIKEDSSGNRKSDGNPYLRGCDGTGNPLDPDNWWNLEYKRNAKARLLMKD